MSANSDGLQLIHPIFHRSLHSIPGDALIVNLSGHARFGLKSVSFSYSRLDVADTTLSYYILNADTLIQGIAQFIKDTSFRSVFVIGSSKAGFGALMLTQHLAAALPAARFTALAFSPQTSLWPPNPAIHYPSYKRFIARAEAGDVLAADSLVRFGKTPSAAAHRNLRWYVAFGARNGTDSAAAALLEGGNIIRDALPMRSHSTILPFLCNANDEAKVRTLVAALTGLAGKDQDIAVDVVGLKQEGLVREIMKMSPRPNLLDLVARFYAEDQAADDCPRDEGAGHGSPEVSGMSDPQLAGSQTP